MVKVTYCFQKNSIKAVQIEGHANFSQSGNDIVCAGISAIVIGTLNALAQMQKQQVKVSNYQNGLVEIKILNDNQTNQIILTTMLWQLKTISDQYPQYLKIKEV